MVMGRRGGQTFASRAASGRAATHVAIFRSVHAHPVLKVRIEPDGVVVVPRKAANWHCLLSRYLAIWLLTGPAGELTLSGRYSFCN